MIDHPARVSQLQSGSAYSKVRGGLQGQGLMQAYGDVLLGWHYFPNSLRPDYYVAIAAYLGGKDAFDRAIADFSAAHADKNEQRLLLVFETAAAAGQIAVQRGL